MMLPLATERTWEQWWAYWRLKFLMYSSQSTWSSVIGLAAFIFHTPDTSKSRLWHQHHMMICRSNSHTLQCWTICWNGFHLQEPWKFWLGPVDIYKVNKKTGGTVTGLWWFRCIGYIVLASPLVFYYKRTSGLAKKNGLATWPSMRVSWWKTKAAGH